MLKGKHIAITGILGFYKREDAFSEICDRGGIPQERVTHKTDILVVGHYRSNSILGEKSRKRLLAEKYIEQGNKIRIIREDEFLSLLWLSPLVKRDVLQKSMSLSEQTEEKHIPEYRTVTGETVFLKKDIQKTGPV